MWARETSLKETAGRREETPRKFNQDGVNKPIPGKQGGKKKSQNYPLKQVILAESGIGPGTQWHQ